MRIFQTRTPQILLIFLFIGYYSTVEYLLISSIPSSILAQGDFAVLGIISFLNFIPAGIFSFAIVSLLPQKYCSSTNEHNILAQAPIINSPRVAILYTTYNDFMVDHAEYDLESAKAAGFPFFILDDSTDPIKRGDVEQFAHKSGCRVLHRNNRKGYKAGAMNAWIDQFGGSFDYFFILDSDSRAARESVQQCIELARRDPDIAVVQTKTLTMTTNPTRLTISSVCVQHAYMEIVQRAMRNLGTTPYYGHNALIRVNAVKSVGGFVQESNEDYKTLTLLYGKGFKSIYAESAITWEEVPPDYMSARKRSIRWSRDAVSQLGLMRFGNPLAIMFFLFYGWVTHISNLALLLLLPILTAIEFPHLFSNYSTELAGFVALSVIFLWPLLALRIDDAELKPSKLIKSLFWGSVFNIPMMAPLGVQIVKTSVLKLYTRLVALVGINHYVTQEFTVTPKTKNLVRNPTSIVQHLKPEISLAVVLLILALATDHTWSLLFAAPQIISSISIPILVYNESRGNLSQQRLIESRGLTTITPRLNLQGSPRNVQDIYILPQMYQLRRIH